MPPSSAARRSSTAAAAAASRRGGPTSEEERAAGKKRQKRHMVDETPVVSPSLSAASARSERRNSSIDVPSALVAASSGHPAVRHIAAGQAAADVERAYSGSSTQLPHQQEDEDDDLRGGLSRIKAAVARWWPSSSSSAGGPTRAQAALQAASSQLEDISQRTLPRRDFAFAIDDTTVVLFGRRPRNLQRVFGLEHGSVVAYGTGGFRGMRAAVVGERGGQLWLVDLRGAEEEGGETGTAAQQLLPLERVMMQQDGNRSSTSEGAEDAAAAADTDENGDDDAPCTSHQGFYIDTEFPTAYPVKGRNLQELMAINGLLPLGFRVQLPAATISTIRSNTTSAVSPSTSTSSVLRVTEEQLAFLSDAPDIDVEIGFAATPALAARNQGDDDDDPAALAARTFPTRVVRLVPTVLQDRGCLAWATDDESLLPPPSSSSLSSAAAKERGPRYPRRLSIVVTAFVLDSEGYLCRV